MEHVELIDPQGIGQGFNVMDPAYNAVYQTQQPPMEMELDG